MNRIDFPSRGVAGLWLSLAACAGLAVAGPAADELLAGVQSRLDRGDPLADLAEILEGLGNAELKDLTAALDRAWPEVRTRYLEALKVPARAAGGGDSRQRVRKLRVEFMRVRGLGEDAMKPLLREVSMPAVDELRRLLQPTAGELVEQGGAELAKTRQSAREFAAFRDAALDAALATVPSDSVATLDGAEQEVVRLAWQLDRDGLRILDHNRKIAEDAGIPEGEAAGIEECNLWRLFVGLNALVLDPKLCEASRDHSKDMAERGFFAHQSPVPGKESFTDRARLAGTSASAENIYAGGSDPRGANTGWFFSPGHHKNMFAGGHQRIGLGHHGGRWTQMFGR